jgi:bifunctional UDP-N-acetylglucosamine pyrophosphorylase/glucosamine-1-phosphate N-acetyltransferase
MTRAIVLAAGKGTRMKSRVPKVLHELCGLPMLWHVLRALRASGIDDIVVVASPELEPALASFGVRSVIQEPQRGTGHAVQVALFELEPGDGTVVIANGDMPLVERATFEDVQAAVDADAGAVLALVTARMPLPSSFGRIVRRDASVERIVEYRDASDVERTIDEMNAGIYAFHEPALREVIGELRDDNAQGEFYLTDTVGLLVGRSRRVVPVVAADYRTVLGVNDRVELAVARATMNARLCEGHMRAGVTIVDPATTYLDPEVAIAPDAIVYPNTTLGGATSIGAGARIGPNARLIDAQIGADAVVTESVVIASTVGTGATVGPFAHLRGGAVLGENVHIGNFVEVKKSTLAAGVKAGHLSYLGDATIGSDSNIGAGTITCNYDGEKKNQTTIGRDVFIGSNSSLVAPLSIGDGALTGAGAVVLRDVPPGDRVVGNPARSIARSPTA